MLAPAPLRSLAPWLVLALAGPLACAGDDDEPAGPGAEIVGTATLETLREQPDVMVLDVRGADAWAAGHVPGATVIDAADLRATVDGIEDQVTPIATTIDVLGAAGVTRDDRVVVYGDTNDTAAARVVWTLRYHGHAAELGMLDGGFARWQSEQRAVVDDTPARDATAYDAVLDLGLRVDAPWVRDHLDDPDVILVDARSPEEFAAGHIPGARSVEWTTNLTDDGAFRPEAELGALYGDPPADATLVVYCQTGSRASVDWLVLVQLGYADVRLYDGSWSEWSALSGYPQET